MKGPSLTLSGITLEDLTEEVIIGLDHKAERLLYMKGKEGGLSQQLNPNDKSRNGQDVCKEKTEFVLKGVIIHKNKNMEIM